MDYSHYILAAYLIWATVMFLLGFVSVRALVKSFAKLTQLQRPEVE